MFYVAHPCGVRLVKEQERAEGRDGSCACLEWRRMSGQQ
ncbi:hypothetical protein ADILRU_0379 [Leifsonia rubra CMS 76R]|nr:hypothetical protein ADILRU_0379 [Leifsonia rubra CMS 76R]